jgi:hypothetical protein
MTDSRTSRIRAAVIEIVEQAPLAPSVSELAQKPDVSIVQPRRLLLPMLAFVAVAVTAIVVWAERGPEPHVAPAATTTADLTTVATTAASTSTSPPTSTSPTIDLGLAATSGWFLPADLPAGYELANLTGWINSESALQVWTRVVAGSMQAVELRVNKQPDSTADQQTNASVHGLPALSYDGGDGQRVRWAESGLTMELRSAQLSGADLLAVAAHVIVDPATGTATIPAGSEPDGFRPSTDTKAPLGTVHMGIVVRGPKVGLTLTVDVKANRTGLSLDEYLATLSSETPGATSKRVEIGGIERAVIVSKPDSLGTFRSIIWVQQDSILQVDGRASLADMEAFVAGLHPVRVDDVEAAGASINDRTLALPTVDQATFDGGITVSVRKPANGGGAICVTAPIQRCLRTSNLDAELGSSNQVIGAVFDIAGSRYEVAWHAGGQEPTTAHTAAKVATSTGVFVLVALAADEAPATISFGNAGFQVGTPSGTVLLDY